MHDFKALLQRTIAVVDDAAALSLEMLKGSVENWQKSDQSPVTAIDIAVDKLLRSSLCDLLPSAGWLSEETTDDGARRDHKLVWIVDPIDGTRSLLNNTAEFAISVALAETGVGPILAVVTNPRTNERFAALRGAGAWQVDAGPLRVSTPAADATLRLLVSRTELDKGLWRDLPAQFTLKATSSLAYKLALVAKGDADATMTPWRRHEWDAAAGDLLVREAGGRICEIDGSNLVYNKTTPRFEGVLASSGACWQRVSALAPELARRRDVVIGMIRRNEIKPGESL